MKLFNLLVLAGLVYLLKKLIAGQSNPQPIAESTAAADAVKVPASVDGFLLGSPAFHHGEAIPREHACNGSDLSPPLSIAGTPEGTQSLALILEDPDAPLPPVFDHWLLWNIAPDTHTIAAGTVPEGSVQGRNTLKNEHYNGPCTPNGTHRYYFSLYSLDTMLSLPAGASKAKLEEAMAGHILAKTVLIGLYTANPVTQAKLAVATAGSALKP